nr:40S ribosomal protein S4-like [Ipomoea batatas]
MFADIFHFHHRRRRRKLQGDVKLPTSSISTMVEATNQLAGEEEPRQCSLSVAVGLQFERERRGCWPMPFAPVYNMLARGLKKHMKRLNAPKHWMLDKLGGAFAPKPSSGPHKSRECLPLILIIRNRLKYALTYREVISILMQRHVLVDGKVRTDKTYPAGFMDVVSIPKTNENFRLLYDTKGRFRLHSIRDEEAKFKLCKVRSVQFGKKGIPYINTYDGRTIRYPDPLIKANDTVKLDLESNKIVEFIKFDVGNVVMVTGGRNRGRVGVIKNREKHKGSFETVHIQDALGHEFATRLGNVFTIGKGTKPWVSLPKGKGIKLTIIEEAKKRLAAQSATTA